MKVAIVGSRNSRLLNKDDIIRHIPPECKSIISGGASGIDSLAEQAALEKGIPLLKFLPNYKKYGAKAPLVRNCEIVEHADMVLAFWDYHSRGTAHTITKCIELHVPVEIIGILPPR